MKTKKLLILFFIFLLNFIIITKIEASPILEGAEQQILPISTTYKQGIYSLSLFNGYKTTAKLITTDTNATLIVVDSSGKLIQFVNLDKSNSIVTLGTLHEGYIGIMIGAGEIAISPFK